MIKENYFIILLKKIQLRCDFKLRFASFRQKPSTFLNKYDFTSILTLSQEIPTLCVDITSPYNMNLSLEQFQDCTVTRIPTLHKTVLELYRFLLSHTRLDELLLKLSICERPINETLCLTNTFLGPR